MKELVKNTIDDRNKKFTLRERETALKGFLKTHRIDEQAGYDPKTFLKKNKKRIIKLINTQNKPIKLKLTITCEFEKHNIEMGEVVISFGYFHTKMEIITGASDLSEIYNSFVELLKKQISSFENSGSGWIFSKVKSLHISMNPRLDYQPLPRVSEPALLPRRHGWIRESWYC